MVDSISYSKLPDLLLQGSPPSLAFIDRALSFDIFFLFNKKVRKSLLKKCCLRNFVDG